MIAGISQKHWDILLKIFEKYPNIKEVILYGSRAKGTQNERSDVDLVLKNSCVSYRELAKLIAEINESNFPYLVDMQIFEQIQNQRLLEEIEMYGKPIYPKKN
ncbi:nucleotidyltransferase domain-containing protein [Raineya orbicola]|jgi:predicted nucleotidyltransferase|uniref:Nucleotidyltransferase domain n=1 Tax=Raineya orbicola TaxID=2016530 RepID=A0A2N3IIQ3_9BACT|nr:nucleotidyltransferase domain-containing protein [Raineya orbicola]PKQ70138.1 Nucleotidyltransferase domain [Raineya orbicola]